MAKKNYANRPAQKHLKMVRTRDGRMVRNLAYDPNHAAAAGGTQSRTQAAVKADDIMKRDTKPKEPVLVSQLIAVDSRTNSNKEYRIYRNPDGTVTAMWGRVGANRLQSKQYPAGHEEKLKASKMKRGYTEAKTVQASSTAGSIGKVTAVDSVDKFMNPDRSPGVRKMLSDFTKLNSHNIEILSGGNMTVSSDGLVKTPLGIVDREAIDDARTILAKGSKLTDADGSKYLRLIPQKTPTVKHFTNSMANSEKFRRKQEDLLRQLESSVDVYEQRLSDSSKKDGAMSNPFRHTIREMDPSERAKVEKLFMDNVAVGHINTSTTPKIKNVFSFEDNMPTVGDGEKSRLAFHGTSPANCLSLSTGGLKGPADLAKNNTSVRRTGSMFSNLERPAGGDPKSTSGTGVYLAQTKTAGDWSKFGNWGRGGAAVSKSLGYASSGAWLSKSSGSKYVFLVEAFTGNECRSSGLTSNVDVISKYRNNPKYDSIVVKGGEAGVANDEMVVPSSRCRIRAIIEVE